MQAGITCTVACHSVCVLPSTRVSYVTLQGLAQDADKYKATAAHVELSKKMYKRDPATAPVVGDRVPYVIIKVSPLLQSMAADIWSHKSEILYKSVSR